MELASENTQPATEQQPDVTSITTEQLDTILNAPAETQDTASEPVKTEPVQATEPQKTEQAKTEDKPAETQEPKPEIDWKAEAEKAQKILAVNQERIKNMEKFISRQGTEIGALRKEMTPEEKAEYEQIRELAITDPLEANEKFEAFKAKRKQAEQVNQIDLIRQKALKNQEDILHVHPDFANKIDLIAEVMAADGEKPQTIENFKKYPFLLDALALHQLTLRADMHKDLNTYKAENERLKAEVEELKARPDQILQNLANAPRGGVNGSATGGSIKSTAGVRMPHQMTSEELNQILNGG